MTSPVGPPRPRDTAREIKRAMRTAELAPAGRAGQLASYLQIVLALGLLCVWSDRPGAFVASAGALGLGVAVGLSTPIGERFRNLSGMVAALAAVFVTVLLLAFSDGRVFGDEPWMVPVVAGLVVLGLDWRFVPRLRARAVGSGALVVPLVGADAGWAYAGAIGWFAGLLVTLWLLERDVRLAALRPVPLAPAAATRQTGVMDVARAVGLGVAVGLVAALLFGDASCSVRHDPPGGGSVPLADALPDRAPTGSWSFGGLTLPGLDASGHEYEYRVDDRGRRYVTDVDGTRLYVEETGGQTLLRDDDGRLRAAIGEDEVTVYGQGGDSQTYRRGDDGRLRVEGTDGQQYTLDREQLGWVLRDESGAVVAGGDPSLSPDHLDVRDPEGNLLVPDANGDGLIPVPEGAGGGVFDDEGARAYERDANGDVVVRDPDGTSRTYDRDDAGRDRVRVEGDGGTRTYVYDESGGSVRITEYDEDGRVLDELVYDPDGSVADRSAGSSASGRSGSSAGGSASTAAGEQGARGVPWALIGLSAIAVAVVVALVVWLRRRDPRPGARPPHTWAEHLARRLDDDGRSRGRSRRRGETVVDHSAALAGGPLPDARVATVGQILSSALFGPREPGPDTRRWVESVVDEVTRANPSPVRRGRRRPRRHR